MTQWPMIGITMAGLAALILCVRHDGHMIQADITNRTTQALTEQSIPIPPKGISVEGRDVTLTGMRGTALVSDTARDIVANIWGVRVVNVKTTEPPPVAVAAPAAPPSMPPAAQKIEADLTRYLEGKTIRFDASSDRIHPQGRRVLDQVFRILATAPNVAVDITGHTDADGDAELNLELSKRRAAAVKKYLASKGIKAERMETDGFGSTKPIAPNDTPANKAKNRRIEFHANARVPGAK